MSEAKIEVNDRWIQCSAQVRLRKERKGDSISLFEIWPGIGWRADYAATATTFVMKVPLILEI